VISVKGYPDVTLQNMFAPTDAGQPAAFHQRPVAGRPFGRIYDNPFDAAPKAADWPGEGTSPGSPESARTDERSAARR
jgi:hypothetical protein